MVSATDIIHSELQKLRKNHWEKARFHATLMKQKLQYGVSNVYHSLKVTEFSQEPLGEGMLSHDAHEEESRFYTAVVKRKLQNGVSNGYHSLRVAAAFA